MLPSSNPEYLSSASYAIKDSVKSFFKRRQAGALLVMKGPPYHLYDNSRPHSFFKEKPKQKDDEPHWIAATTIPLHLLSIFILKIYFCYDFKSRMLSVKKRIYRLAGLITKTGCKMLTLDPSLWRGREWNLSISRHSSLVHKFEAQTAILFIWLSTNREPVHRLTEMPMICQNASWKHRNALQKYRKTHCDNRYHDVNTFKKHFTKSWLSLIR